MCDFGVPPIPNTFLLVRQLKLVDFKSTSRIETTFDVPFEAFGELNLHAIPLSSGSFTNMLLNTEIHR
jgi:hypothetical protein